MTISNLYEAAIDYIVVKVGNDTSLTGQTVIVDDDSSLIQYSGQWTRNTNTFTSGRSSLGLSATPGYPYGNATHWSSKPGDNFTFRFSGKQPARFPAEAFQLFFSPGTSIAIYGIISWNDPGSLAATYSIDGTPHLSFISVDPSATGYTNDGEVTNQLYFYLDRLSSGPHTLFVNITEANHQIFKLDYIVYAPSFDTLSSMPSLSAGISSTTGSGASSSTASASHHSVSTGAFVGGVFGGLAIGVLLTLLLILYRRRAQQQGRAHQAHDAALGGGLNDANILSVSNSRFRSFRLIQLWFTDPSGPNYFQMQEHQSPFSHRQPFRPLPYHERSSSVTSPDSNTTPTYSATGGNSKSVDEPWADTPPHDTISDPVNCRP
jgi:hypothetical protein